MSYTRSYSSSVSISGTVSVSYPASKHGGTISVPYSESVPVNINVTVATEPFDASVSSASASVDGLTASVAAMNAANCAVIKQCSDQISDSLINGFYNLIQSDITTKKSETYTAVQTKCTLLLEHSKAVQDKHARMLSDVEREHAKFGKVFNELDTELKRRITEINKPAFTLGHKVRNQTIVEPYLVAAAATADQLGARSGRSGSVAAVGLRKKVSDVFQHLSSSLHNNLMYRHMMRNILWDKSNGNEQQLCYIPVAYCVFDDIKSPQRVYQCYVSDDPNRNAILSFVSSYVGENNNIAAKDIPDMEMKLIDQAFSSLVQDSSSALNEHNEFQDRVYTEICRLWKDNCQGLKQL